eukprot:UN04781
MMMFGFVRTRCLIALENTPQDIINLCLLFYTVGDYWDTTTSDSRLLTDEGQVVISKENCLMISRYYAFGKDTCQKGQKRIWKFQVVAKDPGYERISLSIGIIHRSIINEMSFDVANNNDYLYDQNRYKLMLRNGNASNGQSIKRYCSPINVGDIIEMELDMQGAIYSKLSYFVNNIPKGIAYDNIPTKCGYYSLCVAFQRRDKLQIIPTFKKGKIL